MQTTTPFFFFFFCFRYERWQTFWKTSTAIRRVSACNKIVRRGTWWRGRGVCLGGEEIKGHGAVTVVRASTKRRARLRNTPTDGRFGNDANTNVARHAVGDAPTGGAVRRPPFSSVAHVGRQTPRMVRAAAPERSRPVRTLAEYRRTGRRQRDRTEHAGFVPWPAVPVPVSGWPRTL